jgi:hypothetical protein
MSDAAVETPVLPKLDPPALGDVALLQSTGRRLAAARVVMAVLGAVALGGVVLASVLGQDLLILGALAAAGVWLFLSMSSNRHARRVREAAALATLGRVESAEGRAMETLKSFVLNRPTTIGAAAVLARVRYSQGRYAEAAVLSSFVLERPERALGSDKRGIRLLMGESLVEAGRVHEALAAVAVLYAPPGSAEGPLVLSEAMRLLQIQLRAQAALGQWDQVRDSIGGKLDLIELMPGDAMAKLTRLMAEATGRGGQAWARWTRFLQQRADLLEAPS